MRLPSSLLAKLYLTGFAVTAACEPAHKPDACETKPIVVDEDVLDETIRGTTHEMPAVAPRYPQPQHTQPQPSQPQPTPVIKKKPPPRKVWKSMCGHMELVDENAGMMKCGMG